MRRLPVYLLIDCSESMMGGGIEAVRAGLASMVAELRRDPQALDTVHLAVITFDDGARVAAPLTPLLDFQQPDLSLRQGTALGAALNLLADRMGSEVRITAADCKGDYRPLVLLLTDGQPSDDWRVPLSRVGAQVRPRPANIYAIGCGIDVDYAVLQNVTDVVLRMEDMRPEAFAKLFVWLTASVASASRGMGEAMDGRIRLEKLPDSVEAVAGRAEPLPPGPARQVFLRARCAVKLFPYLMRYRLDPALGCYQPVKSHRLAAGEAQDAGRGRLPDVPGHLLNGAPACPWCENPGAGCCGNCGTLFCSDPRAASDVPCPGCGTRLKRGGEGGQGGFQVRQSQG
jgi:uncharacterized protein YegL